MRLRDEAELAQAEAEARARAQASGRARSKTPRGAGRREAQMRAARAEVTQTGADAVAPGAALPGGDPCARALEEQISDRYRDVVLAEVVYDYHLRPLVSATRRTRATELRGLIERMGEINLTAIEESEELQKRSTS